MPGTTRFSTVEVCCIRSYTLIQMKHSKKKFIRIFLITFGVIALTQHFLKFETPSPLQKETAQNTDIADSLDAELIKEDEIAQAERQDSIEEINDSILQNNETLKKCSKDTKQNLATSTTATLEKPKRSLRAGSRVWNYNECFPDIQDVQIEAAIKNGITPAETREDVLKLVRKHKLVDITTSPFYVVDDLTHSMPYLVPKAQQLLNTIAINFIDSLQSKGLQPHLPVISSVLRSVDDVQKLQRGNRNATTNSCHCYGTTIDIAYHRFIPLVGAYEKDQIEPTRWNDNLKFVLAEVLYDLRDQGKCYVKYEYHQACFHLTIR